MNNIIPINLVVEDDLSEVVIKKILSLFHDRFAVGTCYGKSGFGYIKKRLRAFNNAAKGTPYIVVSDLEAKCPPIQIQEWLSDPISPNLMYRIAVKEIESWVMADRMNFSSFLGISQEQIPQNVDSIVKPKHLLIEL